MSFFGVKILLHIFAKFYNEYYEYYIRLCANKTVAFVCKHIFVAITYQQFPVDRHTRHVFVHLFSVHFPASHKSARYSGSMNCSAHWSNEWAFKSALAVNAFILVITKKIYVRFIYLRPICVRECGVNFIWLPHCASLFQTEKKNGEYLIAHHEQKDSCAFGKLSNIPEKCAQSKVSFVFLFRQNETFHAQLQNSVCRQSA